MIITAIGNWQPAPGTLLEWHPTAGAKALAAEGEPHPVGPTFLQQTHVAAYLAKQADGGEHRAFLGVATELDGDLDIVALTKALTRFVARHDGLQTYFAADGSALVRHRIDTAAIDFEAYEFGTLAATADFESYIHDRFATEATPIGWPGFSFGAVSRRGGFTLYYGCDHAFSDGASQALAMAELVELYRAEVDGTEPAAFATAPTDGFITYAADEHRLAGSFGADSPELAEWLALFAENGSVMPSFPLDLGLARGETAPVRPVEFDLLDAADTTRFDAACKAAGGKLISGLYAALAITDYEVAGRADYYGMPVLGSRDRGNFLLAQGWMCNFAPVAFHTAGSSSFEELVAVAHEGHLRAKRLAAVPVQSVLQALLASGASVAEVTASPNMLSYIDFRWFPGVGTAPYERGMIFTGEGRTANASMWINRDHERLYLGSQTPDTPLAIEQLARYHEHLRRVIATIAKDGDYRMTPPAGEEREEFALARHHD